MKNEIDRLADIPNLHLDIEDGNFVPDITFGLKTISSVAEYVGDTRDLDLHLFVNDPLPMIRQIVSLKRKNIKRIAVHIETLRYPLEVLQYIRDNGMEAGIGLNFITPVELIRPFVDQVDYVIVMTAEPDGKGILFNPKMLPKIESAVEIFGDTCRVWADGCIGESNIKSVVDAGAANIVLGRTMYTDRAPQEILMNLRKICSNNGY